VPEEAPSAVAVPAPTAPPSQQAVLDDYFERLDAAFSTLGQAAPAPPPPSWEPEPVPDAAPDLERPAAPPAPLPAYAAAAVEARDTEPQAPVFADAFSALLAAERGESDAGPVLPVLGTPVAFVPPPAFAPPLAFVAPVPAIDLDALADRVTRQVLEHLTDRVVREAVTDIVSKVAERLVRDEIERLKASLR
jgi:hypothetical protein